MNNLFFAGCFIFSMIFSGFAAAGSAYAFIFLILAAICLVNAFDFDRWNK